MYPFKCDMSDTSNVQEMFEWIENHSELGRVDVCICNAALVMAKPLSEIR
jgi:NAD(P)-dependent dehydrogenase (short-subunit alcohol dehydrogenase family)